MAIIHRKTFIKFVEQKTRLVFFAFLNVFFPTES